MEAPLRTINVWEINVEPTIESFLRGVDSLLLNGDIIVFASYEPTPKLTKALIDLGAIQKMEIPELWTAFEMNRKEHPEGCAFVFKKKASLIKSILATSSNILKQKDLDCFYDHFSGYREGFPTVNLINHHDASCGGTIYISGHYDESAAVSFASEMSGNCALVKNPALL